jgi:hypothetical protein
MSFIRTEGHSFQITNEMIRGLEISQITKFIDFKRNFKNNLMIHTHTHAHIYTYFFLIPTNGKKEVREEGF